MEEVDRIEEDEMNGGGLAELGGERAANLYAAHRLCCSESVLVMMNQAFGGGLDPETARRLGTGFCHGMGGAGCSCGALTGGVMALSLLLGPKADHGLSRKEFDRVSRKMHDRFKERFRATCCRVLTKRFKDDPKGRRRNCLALTRGGAEMAVSLLLETCPELAGRADRRFLESRAGL